jgi:hypothetical protein
MRYFHRTSLSPDEVLEEADHYFPSHAAPSDLGHRHRVFSGTIGRIEVRAQAEGGHYTLITLETDNVGESEADKVAKRFLTMVHKRIEPTHVVRGAY